MPPPTLSDALTEKIRELLRREHWTQRDFAEQLGVTQGAVSYLLAAKRRRSVLDYYEKLAGIFGVPLSVLIADLEGRVRGEPPTDGAACRCAAGCPCGGPPASVERERLLLALRTLRKVLEDAETAAAPRPRTSRGRRTQPADAAASLSGGDDVVRHP